MPLADYIMGSTGGGVSDLQAALNDVGAQISVDGSFGPETQSAVMRFQQARGLRPDGIAGPGTLIELATARGEGWTMPPPAAPGQQPGPIVRPSIPGAQPAGGPDTKMLFMLVGAGILIWWWTSQKGSSGFGRSRPHPTDVALEDEDEGEEEPEEEESEGGEDEEDEDEEEGDDVD